MKTMSVLRLRVLTVVALVALFVSCSEEEDKDYSNLDYSEVLKSQEIDKMSETLDDFTIEVYENQELNETGRSSVNLNSFPDCVTVTVVAQQNNREITIDFGNDGCVVNGTVISGQILLTYTRDTAAQEALITKTFTNFYFNAKQVIGGETILRELENQNGNPQFTKTTDITVVWPNGAQASRQGTRIREWVSGFYTAVWSDNVFDVTGNWTSTFINGNTHSYTVLTALRREAICSYFVSGSINVQRTNFGGVFDYGDGSCDNAATFTFNNGTQVDVELN